MDSKPSSAHAGSSRAPPLPPRQQSYTDAPPPYDAVTPPEQFPDQSWEGPWAKQDPRSSSTQSLVPSESNAQNERRKLLLIYIHGFMGNETSFRSFPAHVHNLLTVLLAETHVVHTKVYPRYRSKRHITVARDDFSKWLEPHEDAKTDVVLLGHSMGGLLSAEIVLMPPSAPARRALKHRILGIINFDVPFLGMHPGVVKSGLASMFQSSDEPPGDKWSSGSEPAPPNDKTGSNNRQDTLWQPGQSDPNFNPTFANDVALPMRKGLANALHFIHKHSGHLTKATKQLVTSHIEFGGAMANYPELKARYSKIRIMEEEDDGVRKSLFKSGDSPPRVRFINYYTASTGRVKKAKSPLRRLSPRGGQSQTSLSPSTVGDGQRGRSQPESGSAQLDTSRSPSPRISLEEHSDEGVVKKQVEIPSSGDEEWDDAAETLSIDHPGSNNFASDTQQKSDNLSEVLSPTTSLSTSASLPPIPDLPSRPPPLDVSYVQDPDTRKLVEKEHARAMKSYEKAVKDREKAIQARTKLSEKQKRKARTEAEKAAKSAAKAKISTGVDTQKTPKVAETEMTHEQREMMRLENEMRRMEAEGRRLRGERSPERDVDFGSALDPAESIPPDDASLSLQPSVSNISRSTSPQSRTTVQQKPRKDRKFCTLPAKDSQGQRDPLWVRVFMENVDEVGAHCGLFFVDERYERLVGEVADRVESWVREDMDRNVPRSMSCD